MSDVTQVRGWSQVLDRSVTFVKLHQYVQSLLNESWTRVGIETLHGQTLLSVSGLTSGVDVEVRRNGVLLHASEYTVTAPTIELVAPLTADEVVTVFYGAKMSPGAFTSMDLGGAAA